MKISDILKGFNTAILNEADIQSKKPRRKFSNDDIARAQDEYKKNNPKGEDKGEKKTLSKPKAEPKFDKQDPGGNKAAKGKYQKPGTDSKRADVDRSAQQAPSKATSLAKDGKGQGQEGGQAMRAAKQDQKVRKGEETSRVDQKAAANKDSQHKSGTLNSLRTYGGDEDNQANASSEKHLDTIGTQDYEEHDFGKDSRPKFNNDTKDNVAHGLDDSQQAARDAVGQDEWDAEEDKQPGDQLPPHNPDKVDILLAADDAIQRQIGQSMKKANDEWFDAQAKADEAKRRRDGSKTWAGVSDMGKEAQKAHQAQKKAERDALPDLSPEAQARADQKAKVDALNKDTRDNKLTGADDARLAASGIDRGSLEVSQRKAQANRDAMDAGEDEAPKGSKLTPYAVKAQQGDQKAMTTLFKNVSPMLMKVAQKFAGGNKDKAADLYGESKVAFMTAIKTFDPERGTEFTTHLMSTMEGMVKDASYQDRGDIQVSKDSQQKISKYNKLKKKWEDQGVTGHQADREIAVELGLAKSVDDIPPKAWEALDKIKQDNVTRGNISMHGAGGTDDNGGEIDADTGTGVQSDFTSDDAMGSQGGEEELESISKQLATAGPDAVKAKMDELISMAGLDDQEADIIQLAFGIGGEDVLSDDDIQMATGMSSTKQRSITDEALYKMAAYIAQENGTDTDEEHMNLKKIYKYRQKDQANSKLGRTVGDYNDDGEDESEMLARRQAKKYRKDNAPKQREWEKKEKAKRQKEKEKNQGKA